MLCYVILHDVSANSLVVRSINNEQELMQFDDAVGLCDFDILAREFVPILENEISTGFKKHGYGPNGTVDKLQSGPD